MKQSVRFAAGAFLAAQSVSVSAAIFQQDDRVSIQASATSVYAPIGIVRDGGRRATGFLVSNCHVLTVKHVLRPNLTSRRRVKFIAVMTGDKPWSGGVVIRSGPGESRLDDWMLIKLDVCLGDRLGHVGLSSSSPFIQIPSGAVFAPVSSAGYPIDRRQTSLSMDQSCKVVAESRGEWLHDCATLPGNSGSPLFREVRTADGARLEAYAIVTAGAHWPKPVRLNFAYLNTATPVPIIFGAVRDVIEADTGVKSAAELK